jgi:hypothetical protein
MRVGATKTETVIGEDGMSGRRGEGGGEGPRSSTHPSEP